MVLFYLKALLAVAVRALLVLPPALLLVPDMFDDATCAWLLVAIGLSFGWLVPATKHVLRTREIRGPERWHQCQRIEVLVEMPTARALERCAEAVKRIPDIRKMRWRGAEALEARTKLCSGERISCRMIAVNDRHTRIQISSRPPWPTLLVDVIDEGRNWANVVAIREALVSGLPPNRRPSREGPGPRARSPRPPSPPRKIGRPSRRPAARRAP